MGGSVSGVNTSVGLYSYLSPLNSALWNSWYFQTRLEAQLALAHIVPDVSIKYHAANIKCIHLIALVCWACITNPQVSFSLRGDKCGGNMLRTPPPLHSPCWGQTLLMVHGVLSIEPRQPAAIHQTWTSRWNPSVIPDWRQLESLLQHQGNDDLAHAWPPPQTENTFSQRQHTPSSEFGWKKNLP